MATLSDDRAETFTYGEVVGTAAPSSYRVASAWRWRFRTSCTAQAATSAEDPPSSTPARASDSQCVPEVGA